MRLTKIELRDVGRFGHLTADLTGRIVGLVAQNGAGKSTLLSAIHYAVTGDLSRLGDRDAVAINRVSLDKPFVRLTLDPCTSSGEAVVTRWLPADNKAASRKLLHAGKSVTGKSAIDDLFEEWTGLPPKALSDFVFVEQGCLTDVVADTGSRRAEVLQKLFGVSEAESARAAVVEHLSRLPQPADPGLMAAVRAQAASAEHELRMAEAEFSTTADPDPVEETALRDVIAASRRGRELAVAVDAARRRLAEADAVLVKPAAAEPDPAAVEVARSVVSAWRDYREAVSRNEAADAAYRKAEVALKAAEAEEAPEPGPEPTPPPRLIELRGKKFAAFVLASAGSGGTDCPVCGSHMDGAAVTKTGASEILIDLEVEESAHALAAAAWRARDRKYNTWAARVEAARAALREVSSADRPSAPDAPETPLAAAETLLVEADKQRAEARVEATARAAALVSRGQAQMVILQAAGSAVPTDAEVEAADNRLSAIAAAKTRRAAAASSLAAARRANDAAQETLRKAEATGEAHARVAGWRAVAEGAAAILHRDAAPAKTIRACLADLTDDLNRRLKHLGASFRVMVTEDGGLAADFGGTKVVSARRISGGEKVVLSLAWRLAVLDRYAPRAGLLCLDEPTNHLDEARVTALRDALNAWRPHGADRQFVIVTHSKKLATACDQVVELG